MTNAEIFHQAATRHGCGPRLAREKHAGTPAGEGYAYVAQQAETLITSARQFLPRLPQIHFDFVWNGAVNAFAFKDNGQYFIAVTSGAIVLLHIVLNRILADSRLLPHVGDSGSEVSDLPPLVGLIPDAQRMYEAGTLTPIGPRTKARAAYANHIFSEATLFLIGHEIAHITHGHVDYLDSKTANPILPEIGWSLTSPVGSIERQALEADADTRSMYSRLESARLTLIKPGQQAPTWSSALLGVKDVLFDAVFSVNVLFRIFGDTRFAGTDLSTASYPPFPIRRAALGAYSAWYSQSAWGPEHMDATTVAIRYATLGADSVFATITGDSPSQEGIKEGISREGMEHYKLLQDCWL